MGLRHDEQGRREGVANIQCQPVSVVTVDTDVPGLDSRNVPAIDERIDEPLTAFIEDYRTAACTDGYRWLAELSVSHEDRQPDDAEARGPALRVNLLEALTLVVTFRFMNIAIDDDDVAWTRQFLGRQQYGLEDDACGVALQVILIGSLDVPIYVSELADLDFEDLQGALGFEHILIVKPGGDFTHDEAAALAAHIHEDLNHDGDLDTWWQHTGDTVLVGIDGEPEEERGGVQRHRGPLITR